MKLNGHVINKDLNQYHHSGTLFQTSKGFFGQVIRAYDFNKIVSNFFLILDFKWPATGH